MNNANFAPIVLILAGVVSALGTLLAFGPGLLSLEVRQVEVFAVILILIISIGLFLTGLLWLRPVESSPELHQHLPGVTLGCLGFSGMVGGVVVFSSWAWGIFLLLASVIIGLVFISAGMGWARTRELKNPLSLLAGGVTVGLLYVAHQQLDLSFPILVSPLIVVLAFVVPVVTVLYGLSIEAAAT